MTKEECAIMFEEFKNQGRTDDEIIAGLYGMFIDDKIDLEELEGMLDVLGYELDEEFKQMSPEDQKTKGWIDLGLGELDNSKKKT